MGATYWEFRFKFAPDFSRIESGDRKGYIKATQPWKPAVLASARKFGADLVYRRATDQEIDLFKQKLRSRTTAKRPNETPIGSEGVKPDAKFIEFTIDGKKFQAEIIGNRALAGKFKTNTHIQYTSGHEGREWIYIDEQKHTINDDWGHHGIPFSYIVGKNGPKRP